MVKIPEVLRNPTLIGLMAPVCWALGVSLVRGIAEGFGLAQGQTLLYFIAAVMLLLTVGLPDWRKVDPRYLFIGLPTANASSLCFCLAIYFSAGGKQTMEVAMVNYLWPALTLLFAVLFNGVRSRWWIAPGTMIAFYGIVHILAGSGGFSFEGFISRIAEHPLAYILAVGSAVTWAGFSSMTRAWGEKTNLSSVIFIINTLIYGTAWLLGLGTEAVGSGGSAHGIMSVILGGVAIGGSYAAWTIGVSRGNVTILAVASYFTPVLSCLFAVVWIDAELDGAFWSGVTFVVAGSLLCWDATTRGMKHLKNLESQGLTSWETRLWRRLKAAYERRRAARLEAMKARGEVPQPFTQVVRAAVASRLSGLGLRLKALLERCREVFPRRFIGAASLKAALLKCGAFLDRIRAAQVVRRLRGAGVELCDALKAFWQRRAGGAHRKQPGATPDPGEKGGKRPEE